MSYRKKHVKNKINKNRQKKSIFKMRVFWYFLLVLVVVFAGIYFLAFFPHFQVKNITIFGNEKVATNEIKDVVLRKINRKFFEVLNWSLISESIILVNPETIKKEILMKFPLIQSAQITKKLPNSINAQIQERKPSAVFYQNNKYFYIDNEGVIFEELQNGAGSLFIVRQILNDKSVFVGENVIQHKIMLAIFEIEKNLKDNFQIDLKEALISNPLRLDIKTGENWQIYFDIGEDSDIPLQLTKLNLLLKDEITPENRQTLEYIDLRFRDRAFYK
jgi:cell division septal protein FtsQ